MKERSSLRLKIPLQTRSLVSLITASLSFWVLFNRATSEFFSVQLQISFLKVVAKCPGLPYGSTSGGPDYIDIAVDLGLAVVAAVFIALTIRDIRRRRNAGPVVDSKNQESDDL